MKEVILAVLATVIVFAWIFGVVFVLTILCMAMDELKVFEKCADKVVRFINRRVR